MSSELCIPHWPSTWPVDADGFESNLCEVCGTPTHYGSRHVQCAPGWVEPSPQTADQRAWAAYGRAWPEAMCGYEFYHADELAAARERGIAIARRLRIE